MSVMMVESFALDDYAPGTLSRVSLTLVHDGLGRPVRVPMLVARGRHEGPLLGLTAALHGNELNGIPVIHRLMHRLDLRRLHGTVVAVLVSNVPGYHREHRGFAEGSDLNHLFPGEPRGSSPQVYAHRLLDRIVRHFDRLLDLHTASLGRVNSLYVRADMTDPVVARMAYLQRPQIILHNPPVDRTLRGAAASLGIPAITVEIGNPQRFHGEFIKSTTVGVRAVLAEMGMLAARSLDLGPEPLICSRSYWIYTEHGGLLEVHHKIAQPIDEGEPIARMIDVFGDHVATYHAPEAGVCIGHSVNPVAMTGARILHLGILARPGQTFRSKAGLSVPLEGRVPPVERDG
ncbi:MAG: peptidase M14 [Deltaproteobacteria bacterium]|nr:MAG: peptidase M14 [Deltaproteobacteria bacterium]